MKTYNVKMVEVRDWDQLVRDTYGKPYKYQQQDGCRARGFDQLEVPTFAEDFEEDSIIEKVNGPEEGVSFKAWLTRDPEEPLKDEPDRESISRGLELFWHRNFYPNISMLINDLYEKGLIEKGEFAINIDW